MKNENVKLEKKLSPPERLVACARLHHRLGRVRHAGEHVPWESRSPWYGNRYGHRGADHDHYRVQLQLHDQQVPGCWR